MPERTITAVKPHPKKEGQGFVKLDDDTEAWTPEYAKVEPFVGKPIPEGWELKDGPYGKQLLPPKQRGGGGQSAWRNTKEGAEFEAANWRHKQAVEQERMDRRTALMQAVACYTARDSALGSERITEKADQFYAWLRDGSGSASQPPSPGASRPEHSGEPKEALANGEGVGGSKAPDSPGSEAVSAASEPGLQRSDAERLLAAMEVVATTDKERAAIASVRSKVSGAGGESPDSRTKAQREAVTPRADDPAASDSSDGAVNEPRGRTSSDAPSDPLQPKRDKAVELHGSERNLLFEAARFYKKSLSLGQLSEGQLDELIATREKVDA